MMIVRLCIAMVVLAYPVIADSQGVSDDGELVRPLDGFEVLVSTTSPGAVLDLSGVPDGAVVDQSFIGPANSSGLINECCSQICQTFTAGQSGTLIGVNVSVSGIRDYPLLVAIHRVLRGGQPGGRLTRTILSSNSAPLSTFVSFELSADPREQPIPVVAGAMYAICVEYPGAPTGAGLAAGSWAGTAFGPTYAGGEPWARGGRFGWYRGVGDRHFRTYVIPANQDPDCSKAVASLDVLWPPNHRFVPIKIEGVTDPDGDVVTVTVTGVTQDEPIGGGPGGGGSFCPDAEITSGGANLRAERLGNGDGRVYTVSFLAEDGRGGECRGSVRVCVPHDRGQGNMCVDGGGMVDALGPCTDPIATALPRGSLHVLPAPEGTSNVEYSLPEESMIRLSIYDIAGRRVKNLERGRRSAGTHRLHWEAGTMPRGVYFYRLETRWGTVSSRFALMRP